MRGNRDKRSVDEIRATLDGKHCYTPVIRPGHGWIIGRADFGEPGYTLITHESFPTERAARGRADELNGVLGLTPLEAALLVANTMRSQKPRGGGR